MNNLKLLLIRYNFLTNQQLSLAEFLNLDKTFICRRIVKNQVRDFCSKGILEALRIFELHTACGCNADLICYHNNAEYCLI